MPLGTICRDHLRGLRQKLGRSLSPSVPQCRNLLRGLRESPQLAPTMPDTQISRTTIHLIVALFQSGNAIKKKHKLLIYNSNQFPVISHPRSIRGVGKKNFQAHVNISTLIRIKVNTNRETLQEDECTQNTQLHIDTSNLSKNVKHILILSSKFFSLLRYLKIYTRENSTAKL